MIGTGFDHSAKPGTFTPVRYYLFCSLIKLHGPAVRVGVHGTEEATLNLVCTEAPR